MDHEDGFDHESKSTDSKNWIDHVGEGTDWTTMISTIDHNKNTQIGTDHGDEGIVCINHKGTDCINHDDKIVDWIDHEGID